jgi:peptidyl-prolyl cis-trans isomerase A (cyclophilin A)
MRIQKRVSLLAMLAAVVLIAGPFQAAPYLRAPASNAAQGETRAPGLYMTFETDKGDIACKLFEAEAPVTVHTMVGLAIGKLSYVDPQTKQVTRKKFFDGLTFHRVIPDFMIQGGDPLGNGTGRPVGPGFPYKSEVVKTLKFDVPGRLAMANAGPNTNGSQFFVTLGPTPHLDRRHSIFGAVVKGLDVVEKIGATQTGPNDRPVTPVVMNRVTIERK